LVILSQFNGAVIDKDRRYRFLLWRFWNNAPRILFIGLNPSSANELTDDPTIRRLCSFAKKWGYGGLYACNLCSFITPYTKGLLSEIIPHGANIPAIQMALKLSDLIICGWGDGIKYLPNGEKLVKQICDLSESPMCFGLNKSGNPMHPLYLELETELIEFNYKGRK